MKLLLSLLMACLLSPALAQQHRGHGPDGSRPMPPPERRMGMDQRQQLREQVRGGQMTREEARQQWQQRRMEPGRSPEDRERLRRDVIDANRDLQRR